MKVIIESENTKEAMRLINSFNMACAIFEIQRNLPKRIERIIDAKEIKDPYDVWDMYKQAINAELAGINIDELIE